MRKKQKIKILSILFIGLLILSCNYDDGTNNDSSSETSNNFILKKVYLKEYSKNTKLFNQINKVKSKKLKPVNTTGKIVNSSDRSFSINTDFAIYIENKGKHSFTFRIERENPQYLLENLVLNSNDSLGYDAYIVQYDINEDEYNQLRMAKNINLSEKVTAINLIDEDLVTNVFNKEAVVDIQTLCLNTTVISGNSCPGEEHHTLADILAGQYCPYLANGSITLYASQTIYSWGECTISTGGGGSGGSGTGGGTGGGGGNGGGTEGGGDGSDPNIHGNGGMSTTPTLGEEDITIPQKKPCESLKKLAQNTVAMEKITELEGKLNFDKEFGYAYEQEPGLTNLSNPIPTQSPIDNPNIINMKLYTGGNFVGANHTHPNPQTTNVAPMFAPGDIKWLFDVASGHNIASSQKDFSVYFLTLTTANGTFAIKINDWIKFAPFRNFKYEEFYEVLMNRYIKMQDINTGQPASVDDLTIELLKQFKAFDSGVGLFKLDNDKQNWSELTLNPTNPNLAPLKKPCK